MQSLTGRKILVSGGTTGIGRAIVDILVEAGTKVATFARESGPIEELRRDHPDVLVFPCDLCEPDQLTATVREACEALGGLDALVNNAAIAGESITSMPYEEWKKVVEINLIGPMHLTQLALEHLDRGGRIVTIGSMSAKVREAQSDVYVATKAGLRGFVDSLSKVLNPKGIVLTLIEPGLAEADMTTEDKTEAEVAQAKANAEMMDPEDVARMVLFALQQPTHMTIAQIQVRPRAQLI